MNEKEKKKEKENLKLANVSRQRKIPIWARIYDPNPINREKRQLGKDEEKEKL